LFALLAACAGGGGRGDVDLRPPPPPRPDYQAPAARVDLLRLDRAIRLYAEDRAGRLPSSLDDLARERPPGGRDAYLPEVPVDPWGRPYSYAVTSSRLGTFDLRSYGSDTLPGTGDDVVSDSRPIPVP
jgi:general secretion pathway protein G